MSPTTGPASGGTRVTIEGKDLTGITIVQFGNQSLSPTAVSSTKIIFVTPSIAGSGSDASQQSVELESPGLSSPVPVGTFTYELPTVSSMSPRTGPAGGGTTVTIKGKDLTGVAIVQFGHQSLSPTAVSSTKITFLTPAMSAGTGQKPHVAITGGVLSNPVPVGTFTYGT
jgi:IPT/TIG domain